MIAILALSFSPAAAQAQQAEGFDAHGFRLPALEADVRDPLALQRPDGLEAGSWFAGALLEFAEEPLRLSTQTPTGAPLSVEAALDDLVVLNTSAGWAPHERLRVDLSLPVVWSSRGVEGPQGSWLGDARLSARALLAEGGETPVALGLVPYLDLPTGSAETFLGSGAAGGGANVSGSMEQGALTFTAQAGLHLGPTREVAGVVVGDALGLGAAVGWAPDDRSGLTLEHRLSSPLRKSALSGSGAPSELTFSGRRLLAGGGHALGGLAVATSRGVSAAQWRLFVGGGFGSGARSEQRPKEGQGPETRTLEVVVTREGSPVSGASLTVQPAGGGEPVVATTGPAPWSASVEAGSAWLASARLGCLAGEARRTITPEGSTRLEVALIPVYDSTLLVEVVEAGGPPVPGAKVVVVASDPACPARPAGDRFEVAAGALEVLVEVEGRPVERRSVEVGAERQERLRVELPSARAMLSKDSIELKETVLFETAGATILPGSFPLLDEVAKILADHPEVLQVEIGGHTDGEGEDAANLVLSQRRAEAVRSYLVGRGVSAERLVAKGYGETRPMFSNQTPGGRAKNRRVELKIVAPGKPPAE